MYSTDLAQCYFSVPENRGCTQRKRVRFRTFRERKATQLLNSITQDDLQHCFQQWKIRMELCRDREGDYIEGDNISIVLITFRLYDFFSIKG